MATNIGGIVLGDLILGAETTSVITRSVTSTLALTQAIGHTQEAMVQTITFSQSLSYSRAFYRTVTSNLTFSQVIKTIHPESASNSLTLSQSIVYDKAKIQAVIQSIGFTQTLADSHVASRLVVSGIEWHHTRDYDAVFTRPPTNALAFSQTIVAHKCKVVTSSLSFGQTISYTKGKSVKHTLELQQSFVANVNFVRPINTVLGISQQFSKTGRYNRTVSQGLAFGQTIVQARVKGVSQGLSLSQTIVAHAVKNAKNTLAFSQTISYNLVSNHAIAHTLNLEQDIHLARTISHEIHHGFGMNSTIDKHKVMSKTVAQALMQTQQVRFNVYSRSVVSTLSLGQTVAYTPVYPRSVSSGLQFSQTIGLNKTIVKSVVSNLIFPLVRQVYVGMGGIDYYPIENVQGTLIPAYLQGRKNLPHCVLQVTNAAITLPAPEFGDAENYSGVFTIRRSMNNIPYTHVRTLSLRKLKLPFVLAKRKAWELREFLIAHGSQIMTFTTWKGDKWFVNLTTNPLELRVSGRYANEDEKVSVDLEFEGLKVT